MLDEDSRRRGERALRELIPGAFAKLEAADRQVDVPDVIVVCHDRGTSPVFSFRRLNGEPWRPPMRGSLRASDLLVRFRRVYDPRLRGDGAPAPTVFLAFDMKRREAWYGGDFETVQNASFAERLPADRRTPLGPNDTSRLPTRSDEPMPEQEDESLLQRGDIERFRATIGANQDRPEEVFLLHEDVLRMAADTLADAGALDPVPVHTNAIWIFEQPVLMKRPDGKDRAVRAAWFRYGMTMWRMRTYVDVPPAADGARRIGQIDAQLAGQLPFAPVWDEHRPEQQILAAVWALMSQGEVTEVDSEPMPLGREDRERESRTPARADRTDLHVVRVKIGTGHASVYRPDSALGGHPRSAWSVRGHWRRQPYASLGVDEHGKALTKLIWIASYSKGEPGQEPAASKIIEVP